MKEKKSARWFPNQSNIEIICNTPLGLTKSMKK
nr:MAG TPA: hypothetical protein [Caudoviricetes sp.]